MDEYSRILIEKYCREYPKTKKARILSQLIEMSYDLSCEPSDSDAIELEKIIEDERDPLPRRETTIRDNDQQYQMSAPPTVKKVCKYGAILML